MIFLVFIFFMIIYICFVYFFFFQAEDGIRDADVTGVQTCALPISCTDLKMYEIELLQAAMKGGKRMGGLETVTQQMELMNRTMNTETILKMLHEFKEKRFEPTERLVTLYKEQQIDGLLHLMRESSYMNEGTYHEMLTRRNHEWVEKIPEIMQRHATFFAVGAGHLGGEDGVLQLLRTRGYEITPVDIH